MTETLIMEAWEDYDAVTGCKTIYILGEVELLDEEFVPVLRKKDLPGLPTTNLILEMVPGTIPAKGNVVELIYSEEICNQKFYTNITVFEGNKVVTEIADLEHIEAA